MIKHLKLKMKYENTFNNVLSMSIEKSLAFHVIIQNIQGLMIGRCIEGMKVKTNRVKPFPEYTE